MAITKLLHQKESKKGGCDAYLKNAITYILAPEKTMQGLLIGSNCGSTAEEIYQAMRKTKRAHGKPGGRQGYHFVLSFRPREADAETAMQIGQGFCDRYLQDRYDYVFAVHTDTAHLHIHVEFNSVSYEGRKYHYDPGGWQREIQPVTDALCQEHGLPPLTYTEEKKGVSYAEWDAKKRGRPTKRAIVRRDLDTALALAADMEAFWGRLLQMGYQIREGYSKKYGRYVSLLPPGEEKAFRTYTLGKGYSPREMEERLAVGNCFRNRLPRPKAIRFYKVVQKPYASPFQLAAVGRYYRAGLWYPGRKGSCFSNREEIRSIRNLSRQCHYLFQQGIISRQEAIQRQEQITLERKALQKSYNALRFSKEEKERLLKNCPVWELQQREEKMKALRENLKGLRQENRLLEHILSDETARRTEQKLQKANRNAKRTARNI